MKKILQIGTPLITSYADIAPTMAILASDEKFNPWIYNNLNNIVYRCDVSSGTFYDEYYPKRGCLFEQIPFFDCNKIDRRFINLLCDNFVEIIIKSIQDDRYIFTAIDNFYNPNSHAYNREHFHHEALIYGYDDEIHEVYISDFYNGNKYNFYKISFDDINKAYKMLEITNEKEDYPYTYVLNIKKSYDYTELNTNVAFIKQGFYDFINSTENIRKNLEKVHWENHVLSTGISYIDNYIASVENNIENMQSLYVLYDFANILKSKLEFLNKQVLVSNFFELQEQIANLVKFCNLCVNKYIKNQMNGKLQKDRNNLIVKLKELKVLYNEFILNFIRNLKELIIKDNAECNKIFSYTDSFSRSPYNNKFGFYGRQSNWYDTYSGNLIKEYRNIVTIEMDLTVYLPEVDPVICFAEKDIVAQRQYMPILVNLGVDSNSNGEYFQAFNETESICENKVYCRLNHLYHLKMIVNLDKQKYDYYVKDEDEYIQIAKEYKFRCTLPPITSIGEIFLLATNKEEFKIENLMINGEDNTGDIVMKVEKGNAVRNFGVNSKNILAEITIWHNDKHSVNTINISNQNENIISVGFCENELNINDCKIEKDILRNYWNKFIISLENDLYSIYLNDECILSNSLIVCPKSVDRINISTTEEIFIKELKIFN